MPNKLKLMGLKHGQWKLIAEESTYRQRPDTPCKMENILKTYRLGEI